MASATENVIQLDNSKCRICLFTKHNLCPLFRRGLSMKVMKLADIKMYEGDGLPSSICLDCELEVKRSTNFIAQIQRADAKWREILAKEKELCGIDEKHKELSVRLPEKEDMYQVASTSQSNILYDQSNILHDQDNMLFEQGNMLHDNNYHAEVENESPMIEIEEFNVKQEIPSFDQFLSEKEEVHSEGDHDHYGDVEHGNDQPEDENELNPLDHVDIVEDRSKGHGMELSNDPLGQEEPLIETQRNENETSVDPLTCMKQEVVAMDIDKDTQVPISVQQPAVSGPSSSVETSVISMSCTTSPQLPSQTKDLFKNQVVQEFGLNSVSIEEYSLAENIVMEYPVSGTGLHSLNNQIDNIPLHSTASNQFRKKCDRPKKIKLRKPPLKVLEVISGDEFFCLVCNMNFSNLESFKDHKEKNEFLCRVCTVEFTSHYSLETHFLTHARKCRVCKEEFYSMKELIVHRSKMHNAVKKFECKTCLRTCSSQYSLGRHIQYAHNEQADSSSCLVCGKVFKCSFQTLSHLKQIHTAYEQAECKFCHTIYSGPNKLQEHIKKIHLDHEDNVPVSCSTCGKLFNRISLLVKHQETHDNIGGICEICGQFIKTKSKMISHMAMQHSKTGSFKCRICNEQFGVKKDLRMHQKKHHYRTESKPVFCEICGKEYKSLQILKGHLVTHVDERPFKCDVCGAMFKLAVTLKTHSRVHSNVGKYTCSRCGMRFKWKQTFDRHVNKCEGIGDDTVE